MMRLKPKLVHVLVREKLVNFLPKKVEKVIVKNVLFELAKILKVMFPLADVDYPDETLKNQVKQNINLLNLETMF